MAKLPTARANSVSHRVSFFIFWLLASATSTAFLLIGTDIDDRALLAAGGGGGPSALSMFI